MPRFKASKDKLTLLLGVNTAGNLKLEPVLIYYSKNPRALKNYAKFTLPVLEKWSNKTWMTAHLFMMWFTEYFKPTIKTYCSEKKKLPFKILLLTDNVPGYPRALMQMYNKVNLFKPANTTSIFQPMDQKVILTFKSDCLRNIFCKAVAGIDSSRRSRRSQLKTFWKGSTIPDAIKNMYSSWEDIKISTCTGVWKTLIPALKDDFWELKWMK